MAKEKQTLEILKLLQQNSPKKFFDEIEITKQGTGFVLMYLESNSGKCYANSMAEALGVSRSRMAVLLAKLEKKGFIHKMPSSTDGRIDIIEISTLGNQVLQDIKAEKLEKTKRLIDEIGFRNLKKFVNISIKIKHILGR